MNSKHISRLTSFAALLFTGFMFTGISQAAPLPEKFTAVYKVKHGELTVGETKRTLSRKDGQYIFESITRPKGAARLLARGQAVERSLWKLHQGKPRPMEYTYFNSGGKKKRNMQIRFDWDGMKVVNIVNGDPWSMPLEPNTQDKQLYQLHVMQDLPTDKTMLRYPVADGGKMKYYEIEVVGKERVRIDFGTFNTIRLRRVKGSRTTTIWCAEELGYLPIRIQQQKNDDSPVTATLVKLSGISNTGKK